MAVAVVHTTEATGTDSGDGKISKNAWNEGHTITGLGTMAEATAADYSTTAQANALYAAIADAYSAEKARDDVGAALTAGAGITVTVNDGANTITIAQPLPAYIAANWYGVQRGTQAANAVFTADTIYYVAIFIPQTITVSDLGCRITTLAAGGNVKLAIYANTAGVPTGTPLAETGSITTASAAAVSADITGSNVTLAPGLYWAAFWADNSTVALAGLNTSFADESSLMVGATGLSTITQSSSVGWANSSGETYGTWPNATSESFTPVANSTAARRYLMFLKAA